jgi:hypothetical protein
MQTRNPLTLGRLTLAAAFSLLSWLSPVWAGPVPIVTFSAIDLADSNPGDDLWQLNYTVTGTLDPFQSINLLFDADDFGSLQAVTDGTDLVAVVSDPDRLLSIDGIVNLTFVDGLSAGVERTASVSFLWTGTGAPQEQLFEYLDDQFNLIGSGTTADATNPNPVPEPPPLLLAATALLLLGRQMTRRERLGR